MAISDTCKNNLGANSLILTDIKAKTKKRRTKKITIPVKDLNK